MKLLFLLLIFSFVTATGQTTTDSLWKNNIQSGTYPPGASCAIYRGFIIAGSEPPHEKPFTDTVKCMMLCIDTLEKLPKGIYAQFDADGTWHPGLLVIWQRGYEIRKHYWPYHPDYSSWNEEMAIESVGYLDEKKKPLKYMVWLSK